MVQKHAALLGMQGRASLEKWAHWPKMAAAAFAQP